MSQEDFLLGLLLAGLTGAVLFALLGLRVAQRRIRRLERVVAQLGEELWQPDDSTEIIPKPASDDLRFL